MSGRSQNATDARWSDIGCRAWSRDGHCPYLQPKPDEDCLLRLYSSCNATDTGRRFSRDLRLRTDSCVLERRVPRRNSHTPDAPYLKDKVLHQICVLPGFYAARNGNSIPTFRGNISVPSSKVNKSKKKAGHGEARGLYTERESVGSELPLHSAYSPVEM